MRFAFVATGALVLACLIGACGSGGKQVVHDPLPTIDAAPASAVSEAMAQGLVEKGADALARGQIEVAVESLQQGIELGADSAVARYHLATALARLGKLEEAAKNAERAFAMADEAPYVAALDLAARLYILLGVPDRARSLVRPLAAADPDNLSYKNILHRVEIELGDLGTVVREAREVLKKDETNQGAMRNLAAAYLGMKKAENASYVLKQALDIGPDPELFQMMARIKVGEKDVTSAIYYLEKAVEANPDFVEGLNDLGALYASVGDNESALQELQKAAGLAPGSGSVFLHMGNAYRGMQQYREAEAAYKKALELDDTLAEAHYNLGILYLENQVEGIDTDKRLQLSIDEFNVFRDMKQSRLDREDPIDKYIAEARELIKIEEQRREAGLKEPEPEPEEDDGESDDEGEDDDGGDEGDDGLESGEDDGAVDDPAVEQPEPSPPAEEAVPEPAPVEQPALLPEPEPAPVEQPALLPEPAPVEQPALLPEPAPVEQPALLPEPEPVEQPTLLPEPQ